MKHHRSPTHSYPPPATLALRHTNTPIPTLLSPLRSIHNTPPLTGDGLDDFQSNAWLSHCTPLAGLGITYLHSASATPHGQPFAREDAAPPMQVDDDHAPLVLPADTDTPRVDLSAQTSIYRASELDANRRFVPRGLNFVPCLRDEPVGHLELGLDSDMDHTTSDVIGLIPDVNMYDQFRRLDLPHGVNPMDTIRSTSLHDIGISCEESASPAPKQHYVDDALPTSNFQVEQSPSPGLIQDIMSILIRPASEFSLAPWSSVQNSPPSQQATTSASVKLEPTHVPDNDHHALPAAYNLEYPSTVHSSPVLNAHLGIELNELISRAERFRTKYPERDIDRAWLSHFAGKLSDRGELLNDFRCYVVGCDQRNKRRDHILVHVGAHIGQRPFACSVCPLRFLRKNECKRHEASHSGFRPYSCDICGQSFVRQDLVKRHVKRTHGLRDKNDSENFMRPSRKRARLH